MLDVFYMNRCVNNKNYINQKNRIEDQALESATIDHESLVRPINFILGRCSDTCRYTTLFITLNY